MVAQIATHAGGAFSIEKDSVSIGDANEQELRQEYESGVISVDQYQKEMGNISRKKRQDALEKIEAIELEIDETKNNRPFQFTIRDWLPIVQVIGVILVVSINSYKFNQKGPINQEGRA